MKAGHTKSEDKDKAKSEGGLKKGLFYGGIIMASFTFGLALGLNLGYKKLREIWSLKLRC